MIEPQDLVGLSYRSLGYNIELNGNTFECKTCKRKKFYTYDE